MKSAVLGWVRELLVLSLLSFPPFQVEKSSCKKKECAGTNSIKRDSKAQGDFADANTLPPFTMTFFANELTRILRVAFATLPFHEPNSRPRQENMA